MNNSVKGPWWGIFVSVLVAAGLITGSAIGDSLTSQAIAEPTAEVSETPDKTADPTPTPSLTPEITAAPRLSCDSAFTQAALEHEGNKVDSNFEEDYIKATAKSGNLSKAQADLLLKKSRHNAHFLAIRAFELGLWDDPNDWKSLVDDNCLSSEGQALYYQYKGVLSAKGTKFTEATAPANALNSGVHGGQFGVAAAAGITGDRKAIKITLADGSEAWIMVRCANGVFPSKPPEVPEVPTDNPPEPAPPAPPVQPPAPPAPPAPSAPPAPPVQPTCPPGQDGTWPNCTVPKAPEKDPAPRGEAPEGGGENEDPGPGEYQPPKEVPTPPEEPRENPAPPAPEPPKPEPQPEKPKPQPEKPKPEKPKPVPTKDPEPLPEPKPEPKAPKPEAPEEGCVPVPGVTC